MGNTDVRTLFELATRYKWRWTGHKGQLRAEDLWDLPVEALDDIFKKLNTEKRKNDEESLLEVTTRTSQEILLDNKIAIVRHIVQTKLNEAEMRRQYAEEQVKKQQIMDILARKENAALESLSAEELRAMLDKM